MSINNPLERIERSMRPLRQFAKTMELAGRIYAVHAELMADARHAHWDRLEAAANALDRMREAQRNIITPVMQPIGRKRLKAKRKVLTNPKRRETLIIEAHESNAELLNYLMDILDQHGWKP